MNTQIDYITLMHPRSEVGCAPTRFSIHRDGDKPKLIADLRLSFLFVLQGELKCVFNGISTIRMTSQQLMAVDKAQLQELQCVGDTVILECVESDKMSPLMQSTSRVFSVPCSEIITLNTKLNGWCRDIFTDLANNPIRNNNYYHRRCSELTALLLQYPRSVLGILYIPLFICYKHCDTCSKLFVRDKSVSE